MQHILQHAGTPSSARRCVRSALIAAISALALATAAYALVPRLLPQPDQVVTPDPGCDLQRQACSATLASGRVELGFRPHPVPAAKAFRVQLAARGLAPRKVEIDFAGADMDMGPNRTELARAADGSHSADAMLPACISGPMKWRATVILHDGGRRVLIPYEFHTGEGG